MTDDSPARQPRDNRAPIPVSSTPRQPPWDLTLLVVESRGVEIGFAPRATGARVVTLDEAGATALFDVLWMCLPMYAHQVAVQQSTTVVGWDTTWLHVRFDHDRAVVVLQARLVRALDPSESR